MCVPRAPSLGVYMRHMHLDKLKLESAQIHKRQLMFFFVLTCDFFSFHPPPFFVETSGLFPKSQRGRVETWETLSLARRGLSSAHMPALGMG